MTAAYIPATWGEAWDVPFIGFVAVVVARSEELTVVELLPPGARRIGPIKLAGLPIFARNIGLIEKSYG